MLIIPQKIKHLN